MQGSKAMEGLIDKLCDHLPTQRIKLFIESGFDQWETITFMNGKQLPEIGFNPQQCIIIMIAINSQAKQAGSKDIFAESIMQEVLATAKQLDEAKKQQILQQEAERKLNAVSLQAQYERSQQLKQYPQKIITQPILLKGVTLKGKEKVPLNKVTLISLEEKQITVISEMEKVPLIQNLHLSHNHIYKIQNLSHLSKLRILKLQSNLIIKMEGMDQLESLQQLLLSDNHISRFQGLTGCPKLHLVNLNAQKSKYPLTFDENSCAALAYSLQTFHCDSNKISNIQELSSLKVLKTLSLRHNTLNDMGDLSQPLGGMERLHFLDFRGNPLCTLPKYRDYIVILAKSLQQLDNKKILPTERQYLVKLYSLKHAKQMREERQGQKGTAKGNKEKQQQLQVRRLQQTEHRGMYHHGGDLRGNAAFVNTKIQKR